MQKKFQVISNDCSNMEHKNRRLLWKIIADNILELLPDDVMILNQENPYLLHNLEIIFYLVAHILYQDI
jgi:hypothetical protein